MHCSTRNGQALAAAEALTVSELDLQRIKQQGCGTTKQDRCIMRLPDLKALPYPTATNVPFEVSSGANDKYLGRKSINAEGFVPPFANAKEEDDSLLVPSNFAAQVNAVSIAAHGTPGLEFSGSGDIAQLNSVTFGVAPVLYKKIAADIRGEHHAATEDIPTIPDVPQTPHGRAGIDAVDEKGDPGYTRQAVYGSAHRGPFSKRCLTAVRGLLYDFLHYDDARSLDASGATSHFTGVWNIVRRDGRLPYILFVLVFLLLCALLLYIARGALTPSAPPQAFPPLYSFAYVPDFKTSLQT